MDKQTPRFCNYAPIVAGVKFVCKLEWAHPRPHQFALEATDVAKIETELADANARAEAAERKYHLSELNFNAHEKLLIKAESRLRSSVELLKESLSAIEEIHTDNCSAWCGYRELRGKIRDVLNLDAIVEEMK